MKREIITAENIRAAVAAGLTELDISAGAVVTPQAKDLALEKHLLLRTTGSGTPERAGQSAAPASSAVVSPAASSAGDSAGGQKASSSPASLPVLPLLEDKARKPAAVADLKDAVRREVLARLPEQARTDDLVRRLVEKALDEMPQGCAGCGACSCSGGGCASAPTIGPAVPAGPGRTAAGRVLSVDARSLPWERFPGTPDGRINIVDVITSQDGSPMGGGYLEWNATSFPWHLTYAEIDVVLEGELHISSGGATVVGKPGDMLFIPQDTHVIFSSPGYVKFAYVTWPADWSAPSAGAK